MKNTPSIIQKLGFNADDKVVILHIDDIGSSHSSNVASFECLDYRIASCGSIIVPAPWFLEAVAFYKKFPKYDMGVHLTLTCEYNLYRWRALSSVDPCTGLLDSEGCLWRTTEEAITNVTTIAAETELRKQIQTALDNGIDVTHIDTHMGTVMDPKFLPIYLKLAREFKIPAFLPKVTRPLLLERGFGKSADFVLEMFQKLETSGVPMLDHIIIDTGGGYEDKTAYYYKLISEIEAGLTHLLFHAAKISPELCAIDADSAEWRNQDYEAFINPRLKECIKDNDIKIIGYREIRDYLRTND
ncbi:MAG: polysaccharide deacetylase family protein [Candidatus Lokiarchaeota archaeon]|nr:polysaccharide deacetylase family protein [Candidatus Lokiarchaeota archaeon]